MRWSLRLIVAALVLTNWFDESGFAQATDCGRSPLTRQDVEDYLSLRVAEAPLRETLAKCGVTFILDANGVKRIRGLGGSADLVAMIAPPENPSSGAAWTSPIDRRDMAWMPPGSFLMGSPPVETGRDEDEAQHSIVVEQGFWADAGEVTNAAYRQFVLANPQWQKDRVDRRFHDGGYLRAWNGNEFPAGAASEAVVWVSWYAARAYADWAGKRLPTESEWEYAARDGGATRYWWGDQFDPRRVRTAPSAPDPARSRRTSRGLNDVVGGVWQWTSSRYSPYPYRADGRESPDGAAPRTVRGGFWGSGPQFLRTANRNAEAPTFTSDILGFRCVR
jgi:formylglycine-generating enzyme required for sulfatase activity